MLILDGPVADSGIQPLKLWSASEHLFVEKARMAGAPDWYIALAKWWDRAPLLVALATAIPFFFLTAIAVSYAAGKALWEAQRGR